MQTVSQSRTTWALATWSRALGGVVMACDRETAHELLNALNDARADYRDLITPGVRELWRQIETALGEPAR